MGTSAQPGKPKERRMIAESSANNREVSRMLSHLLDLDISPRFRQLVAAGLILVNAQAHRLAALDDTNALVAPALEHNRLLARLVGLLLDSNPTHAAARWLALAAVELNEQHYTLANVAGIRNQKGSTDADNTPQ